MGKYLFLFMGKDRTRRVYLREQFQFRTLVLDSLTDLGESVDCQPSAVQAERDKNIVN